MNSKPQLTIAVTGLNAIDSPGPGVAVIRALREAESFDCRIIGLAYESLEPGIYMHDIVEKPTTSPTLQPEPKPDEPTEIYSGKRKN